MECYNITNFNHNPYEKRPEGLMPTIKTCQEWCGEFRSECVNALLKRSPVYEEKQQQISKDIEDLISSYTKGLNGSDKYAMTAYICGVILGKIYNNKHYEKQ